MNRTCALHLTHEYFCFIQFLSFFFFFGALCYCINITKYKCMAVWIESGFYSCVCVCVCFLAIPKLWHSLFNCYRCIVSSSTVFKWMTTKWFYFFFSDRKIGVKTIILIWFGDEKKNTFSDCVHGNSVLILKRNCVRRIKEDQRNKYSLSCFSMLFHIRLFFRLGICMYTLQLRHRSRSICVFIIASDSCVFFLGWVGIMANNSVRIHAFFSRRICLAFEIIQRSHWNTIDYKETNDSFLFHWIKSTEAPFLRNINCWRRRKKMYHRTIIPVPVSNTMKTGTGWKWNCVATIFYWLQRCVNQS